MLFAMGILLMLLGMGGLILGFARKLRTEGYAGVLPGHESELREAGFPAPDHQHEPKPVMRERQSATGILFGGVAAVGIGAAMVLAGLARDSATKGAALTSPGMPTTQEQPVAAP